eukprot:1481245-Pleurochrysis_carterae.AAC.1
MHAAACAVGARSRHRSFGLVPSEPARPIASARLASASAAVRRAPGRSTVAGCVCPAVVVGPGAAHDTFFTCASGARGAAVSVLPAPPLRRRDPLGRPPPPSRLDVSPAFHPRRLP